MREKKFGCGVSFFAELVVFSVSCYLLHHLFFALYDAADFRLKCYAALDFLHIRDFCFPCLQSRQDVCSKVFKTFYTQFLSAQNRLN